VLYKIAFDPRQAQHYGQTLTPVLVGILMVVIFCAAHGMRAKINIVATFCIGPAVAYNHFYRAVSITVVGGLLASMAHSLVFFLVPPHHADDGCFIPPLLAGAHNHDEDESVEALAELTDSLTMAKSIKKLSSGDKCASQEAPDLEKPVVVGRDRRFRRLVHLGVGLSTPRSECSAHACGRRCAVSAGARCSHSHAVTAAL